jgi:hypothetical protein
MPFSIHQNLSHFLTHCDKFTLGQKRFYTRKFTVGNLKEGVNKKTGVKV